MPDPYGLCVRSLVIDPLSTNNIYAATNYGIYQSIDYGSSWVPINTGLTELDIIALVLESYPSKKILYAGTYRDGVFKKTIFIGDSNDDPWEPMNDGLTNYKICCLMLHKENGYNKLYVGTFGEGVFSYNLPIKSLYKPRPNIR